MTLLIVALFCLISNSLVSFDTDLAQAITSSDQEAVQKILASTEYLSLAEKYAYADMAQQIIDQKTIHYIKNPPQSVALLIAKLSAIICGTAIFIACFDESSRSYAHGLVWRSLAATIFFGINGAFERNSLLREKDTIMAHAIQIKAMILAC